VSHYFWSTLRVFSLKGHLDYCRLQLLLLRTNCTYKYTHIVNADCVSHYFWSTLCVISLKEHLDYYRLRLLLLRTDGRCKYTPIVVQIVCHTFFDQLCVYFLGRALGLLPRQLQLPLLTTRSWHAHLVVQIPYCVCFDQHFDCGVATISRLLKIIGFFCRIWSLLQGSFSFAEETYNFEDDSQ